MTTPPMTRREARQLPVEVRRVPVRTPTEPPTRKPTRPGFRPDIEGLRAIAILLVVLYHCGIPGLPGGYIGVDVFFVISGFLITSHLAREVRTTGRLRIARFYARRALRLLPAATLVIGATLLATWYWAPASRIKSIAWDALAANGYFINYRLVEVGTDYRTAQAAPSPLQHFWSLAVEEQFYLLIPLLLILTAVLTRRPAIFSTVLVVLVGASLGWSIATSTTSPVWAYFSIASRGWELGIGALLAVGIAVVNRIPAPLLLGLRWAGIGAIAAAAALYTDATPFPSYYALAPTLGAAAIIAAGTFSPGTTLANPAFVAIGARSYSWYLWHWPILMLAPYALGQDLNLLYKLGAVLAALGLAALTYEAFEKPMRENRDLRDHPIAAFRYCALLTAAVAALAVALPHLPDRQPIGVGTVAEVTLTGSGSAQTKALIAKIQAAAGENNLPANLTPTLEDAPFDDPIIYKDGCHLAFEGTKTPKKCEKYGDKKSDKVIALYGDSHAAQWFPALQVIAKDHGYRLADYTKSACSAATITMYLPALKGAYQDCDTWRENSLVRMEKTKPAIVVMTSNWGGYAVEVQGDEDQYWANAYKSTVTRLQAITGTKLIYLNDSPWPKGIVPDCLGLHPRETTDCARTYESASQQPRRQLVLTTMKDLGVPIVDPMPWFCTVKICPVVVGNLLVYKDGSHVTPEYARLLAPVLAEELPLETTPIKGQSHE